MAVDLNSFIAELFVFFLPFRMLNVLQPMLIPFGTAAYYADVIFHVLGLLCFYSKNYVIQRNPCHSGDRVQRTLRAFVFVGISLSLVMAIIHQTTYGDYNGESALHAWLIMSLGYVQYIFIVIYCRAVFSILGGEKVLIVLHKAVLIVLLIGYSQVGLYLGIAGLDTIYLFFANILNFSKCLGDISLTMMEPSHAAILMAALIIPYYGCMILSRKGNLGKNVLGLCMCVPIIVFSESSTMYLICGAELLVIGIIAVFDRNVNSIVKILAMAMLLSVIVVFINPTIIDELTGIRFSYLLLEKVQDAGNQSTASRSIMFVANLLIFLRFPIFGCGNGLQGYFYHDYSYMMGNSLLDQSTINLFTGKINGIANGGSFLAGIISGYGIVGIFLFALFIKRSITNVMRQKAQYKQWYYFYLIAVVGILLAGIKSEFVGMYCVWFVLSIPAVDPDNLE